MACEDCKHLGNNAICSVAAKKGHLQCIIWARKNGYPWDTWTCDTAAYHEHLDCLMWARKNGCPWDTDLLKEAVFHKQLKILVWISKNEIWHHLLCSIAAEFGYLDILILMRRNRCKWDKWTCAGTSGNGHLDCLMWARKNGCPWDEYTCSLAAREGHLQCLIWATKNYCPWKYWVPFKANKILHILIWIWQNNYHLNINISVKYGDFASLICARKNNCLKVWDDETDGKVIEYGQLPSLIWAKKCGYLLNEDICLSSAYHKQLEFLIWTRKNGYPWDERICSLATDYDNMTILKWIHAHGSPCDCGKDLYIEWNGWKDEGREDCAICMEKLDESTVKFIKCRHHYHRDCMDEMLRMREREGKKRCSICERGT